MSAALAGIISVAAGLDIYFPGLAFIITFAAGVVLQPYANILERMGINDAVGAVTVHGTIGLFGLIMLGVFGIGYPSLDAFMGGAVRPTISLTGQILGAVVFFLLSFFLVCSVLDPQRVGHDAHSRIDKTSRA